MQTTSGHLLGGRLLYEQPADGYRTGIEPVLLAAAVPARSGQRVLEGGTGAGAGLMCLAARVPGLTGVGVEIDPAMADLARRNIGANGLAGLDIVATDLLEFAAGEFDHAFANPPWHDLRWTSPPSGRRHLATHAAPGMLGRWVGALVRALRPGGTVTLILPAGSASRAVASMSAAAQIIPLLPKAGRVAKLALVLDTKPPAALRATFAGQTSMVLHQDDGRYTPEIEAVLRGGAGLSL